jgi:hypothetical protein
MMAKLILGEVLVGERGCSFLSSFDTIRQCLGNKITSEVLAAKGTWQRLAAYWLMPGECLLARLAAIKFRFTRICVAKTGRLKI